MINHHILIIVFRMIFIGMVNKNLLIILHHLYQLQIFRVKRKNPVNQNKNNLYLIKKSFEMFIPIKSNKIFYHLIVSKKHWYVIVNHRIHVKMVYVSINYYLLNVFPIVLVVCYREYIYSSHTLNILGTKCSNQKIRKNQWFKHLEIFDTSKYGQGLRTTSSIPKGTFLCEYVGEIITDEKFHDRMTNLYSKDEHHYTMKLTQNLVIDAYRMGSIARFANHSCSPNCEFQKWSVDGLQRMCMFSLRTIKPGEELTYDYNFQCFNLEAQQPCYCESSKCRGTIGTKQQQQSPTTTSNNNTNNHHHQHQTVNIQRLTQRDKRMILQSSIFLLRNLRRIKAKRELRKKNENNKLKQSGMSLFFSHNYYHSNGSNHKSTLASLRKTPKLTHKGKSINRFESLYFPIIIFRNILSILQSYSSFTFCQKWSISN